MNVSDKVESLFLAHKKHIRSQSSLNWVHFATIALSHSRPRTFFNQILNV